MLKTDERPEDNQDAEYYQTSIKDGSRGLIGAIMGTTVSEAILLLSGVVQSNQREIPLIFALIGLAFAARHLLQIWQAKQQLKQMSDSVRSINDEQEI